MKAGLLTFHRASNLGAVLQATALQQYLQGNLCDCELIDFVPNNQAPSDQRAVRRFILMGKRAIRGCIGRLKKDRLDRFRRFCKENYHLSGKTYYADAGLAGALPQYDAVISGSDQILNTTLSGVSESYYLKPWGEDTRKISYASSFGREALTEDEYRLIREELPKFHALSVRESSAARIIYEQTGRQVPVVVDPVFLLTKEQWLKKSRPIPDQERYVLAYAMEHSPTMEGLLRQQIAQGKKVLLLCGSKNAESLPGQKIIHAGPGEFLSYISRAELVITNSFHGSALSVILGTPFCCVSHSSRNARLESLMDSIGRREKLLPVEGADALRIVDSAGAYERLLPLIEGSKIYLKQAVLQP